MFLWKDQQSWRAFSYNDQEEKERRFQWLISEMEAGCYYQLDRIKQIGRESYEQLDANRWNNLIEMNEFLETQTAKTEEEKKDMESVIKPNKRPTKKTWLR